jgi:hypothetical protein
LGSGDIYIKKTMSKYLKEFETTADYTAYIATDYVKPNVSYIVEGNGVEYNPYVPPQPIVYYASAKLNKTWFNETTTFGTTIKSHTFENGVGTIEFNDDVTSIGDWAFENCTILTSVTIPNSVTTIGNSAFCGCKNLASLNSNVDGVFNIPSGVTSIYGNAFNGCSGLTSVTIPNSVTKIYLRTFQQCSSLISIEIPSSVTSIAEYAFYKCSALTSVTVERTTPPTLDSSAFMSNASGRKIYVPAASVDTYKAASGWSIYASDIEAIPSV